MNQQIFIEKKNWMKKIQAPKVAAIKMQFGVNAWLSGPKSL